MFEYHHAQQANLGASVENTSILDQQLQQLRGIKAGLESMNESLVILLDRLIGPAAPTPDLMVPPPPGVGLLDEISYTIQRIENLKDSIEDKINTLKSKL